jgi:hypothetical protein
VVPKAFHALDVAVVEAFNVGAAVFTPGDFVQAVQNGRTNILNALNQPVGLPTTPTGATNIFQVVTVEAINVATAVAFQAGELLLAGVIQIPNAAAQELAQSGDPGAALAAGAARAAQVVSAASAPVVSAVNTAVTNIRNSLADPFPAAAKSTAPSVQTLTVKTDEPKVEAKKTDPPATKKASESPRGTKDSDPETATSGSSAAASNVDHPTRHVHKTPGPGSTKDGHPDNHPDGKKGKKG